MNRTTRIALSAAAVACMSLGHQAQAQSTTQPPGERLVEPAADEWLRKMGAALSAASSFSFEAHLVKDEVLATGQKVQIHQHRKIWVDRPGRLHAVGTGDMDQWSFWYENGQVALLERATNRYALIDAPGSIDPMLDHLVETYGLVIPLADLLVADPYRSAMRNTRAGFYVGRHDVRGVSCHHLAFRQDGIDWQIWVDAGDNPLPRKLVITFTGFPAQPQWSAQFDNWKLQPRLADGLFSFSAPTGATQTEPEVLLARDAE